MPVDGSVRLLLDAGGQGCRGIAMDDHGRFLAQAHAPVDTRVDGIRVEQDGMQIAAALSRVAGEVSAKVQQAGMEVLEAGLAVQRGSVVCWSRRTGEPLSPVLSWRDRRGVMNSGSNPDPAEEVRQRTGLRFSPYGGGSKLAWCLANIDAVSRAARTGDLACGPLGSFLVASMDKTRPCLVDDTLAQRTLLWSRHTFGWDPWLLDLHGIGEEPLPGVVAPGTDLARLDAVCGNPPLKLLCGDQNVVPFITGIPRPDTLYINMGTGAFLLRPLEGAIDTSLFQLSLLHRLSRGQGQYALEASVHGAASALRWLENHAGISPASPSLDQLRQRIQNPPLFVNTIDGLGSPWWTQGADAGFVEDPGIAGNPFEARLLAVLESIAFLIRVNFDEMNYLVGPPETVLLCGGLSRNPVMARLVADILATRIKHLEPPEGTALGLWGRMLTRGTNGGKTRPVMPESTPMLHARYDRWLECMERAIC